MEGTLWGQSFVLIFKNMSWFNFNSLVIVFCITLVTACNGNTADENDDIVSNNSVDDEPIELPGLKKVNVDVDGYFEIVIKINDGSISVNQIGEIVDFELSGNVGYDYAGNISSVGSVSIGYNYSKKVSSVGSVSIGYDYAGNISSVGSVSIGYDYAGKVSSVGSVSIGYNYSGKVSSIGSTSYGYNYSGKISSGNRVISNNGITFSLKGGH